jgi:hypothetical protein
MSQQLRKAIEKAKEYYIQRLIETGIYKDSDPELYELTLSEMISLFKKHNSSK